MDIAKQYFKPIPEEVMNQLIEKGDVMHCAGGFMIDDRTFMVSIAIRLDNCDF